MPVADERHAIGCDSANCSVEVVFLSSMSGVPVIFDRQTEQVPPLHVKDEGHFESTIPAAWYATEEPLSRILGEIALESGLNVESRARVYSFATAVLAGY